MEAARPLRRREGRFGSEGVWFPGTEGPGHITVFTDTVEEDPMIETNVNEFDDTLPDGTRVKRKVRYNEL